MAITIAVASQKGGIGKTTTALAIADNLIKRGKKVLFIDTDPQRNSSSVYKAKIDDQDTLYDIFMAQDLDPKECIQTTEYGDIISSDPLLQDADDRIPHDVRRYKYLKKAIDAVQKKYDYIIIDTPPRTGVLLTNVLVATSYVIVPVTCDYFGVQGLMDFFETVKIIKEENEKLKILGLLKIRYKGRQNLTKEIEDYILPDAAKQMKSKVFDTAIRESVKCQEAQSTKTPLFTYSPSCTTAVDYDEFVEKEILPLERKRK